MKRLILLIAVILFFVGNSWAQSASAFNVPTGGSLQANAGNQRLLDAGGKWTGQGYLAIESKTITEICIIETAPTVGLGATDGGIDLYSDSPGFPNASLVSATFNPSAAGLKCVTVSQATVVGTQYWVVTKNLAAVPGTNNFSVYNAPLEIINNNISGGGPSNARVGMSLRMTSNSGADSWNADSAPGEATYRLKFSDNTYFGFIPTGTDWPSNPLAAADRVYGTREVGNLFSTPSNASPKLRCISMFAGVVTGTPTGFIRYGLYEGTTFVAYTVPYTFVPLPTNEWMQGCFATAQTLAPATTYRVALAETTQSDAVTDSYGPYRVDWDTDSNSLPLKPWNGSMSKTICTGSCNGGTWTNTTGSWYPMTLGLEPGDEFASGGGGGGGLINENQVSGGMQ